MPPKRKSKAKKAKVQQQANNSNNELVQITRMLKNMNQPQSQVTDLGRLLLKGGNMVSGVLGFPKVFGSGSYTMTNNCWNASQQVPIMHSSNESVRVRHREYIADISMSGIPFSINTFSVNPGLPGTFPYLSSIAENFQEYSFKGLIFEFKTTSATSLASGTNTAMGSVMLAAQYRADAPVFSNKTQLLNEMWSVDTVPSSSIVLPVECSPAETPMSHQYVRTGTVTGDIKFFDLCTLSVATAGGQTGQNNVVGELWVSYDIELFKPQVSSNVAASGASAYVGITSTWTQGSILNNIIPSAGATINVAVSGNTFTLPQGSGGYFYYAWVDVSTQVSYGSVSTTYTNCHAASNNVLTGVLLSGTLGQYIMSNIILVTAPSNLQASVTFGVNTVPSSTGVANLVVISLPYLPLLWGN
jgi:hypothetical protein